MNIHELVGARRPPACYLLLALDGHWRCLALVTTDAIGCCQRVEQARDAV